ncbi:MAG: crotonase/enoyl-CoA hydratase family protein [Gammaproteobacteria bacterium]
MSAIRITNDALFDNFRQLRIEVEPELATAWMFMQPHPRPCFTPELLDEIQQYQRMLVHYRGHLPQGNELVRIDYQVLASSDPAIFNLGGDLERFLRCIENRDAEWLRRYGYACVEAGYRSLTGYDQSITTISLMRGEALGGGLESALFSHVMIAERDAKMGLPEVLFNLFPGMGAFQLIARRTSAAQAQRMIQSGRIYGAEELYDLGIVDVLAEPGDGIAALHAYVKSHRRRQNANLAIERVRRLAAPVSYDELTKVVDIWVDAAMQLDERDRRTIQRLIRSQNRLPGAPAVQAAEPPLREVG